MRQIERTYRWYDPRARPTRGSQSGGLEIHLISNTDGRDRHPYRLLGLSGKYALSLAEILRANGYATHAVGKWHLARDTNLAPGRTRDSWPLQRGFDSYYGSLEGLNSFYYPSELISDNSVVDVEEYPPDYYVTDDITDKAISRIKSLRAHDADKPFFLYFSHIAMHGPHQAKPEDRAKYRGHYTEGWDAVRRRRFDAQVEAGFFPPGTQMAERNTEPGYDAPPWDELTEEEQLRFARYQEVYAAMVDSIDQSVGRVLDTLDVLGETDNTIIVFTSDNGGTGEGGAVGTRSYFSQFVHGPVPDDWVRDVPHDEELIGSEKIGVHYPRGWGQASNTPFRFYKGQTFAGGVRVPFLLSWPAGLRRAAGDSGLRRHYSYVTDITPTLLNLAGLVTPSHRNGLLAQEPDGVSIADILRDAAQPTPHTEQYAEFGGHRGFYRDGWKLLSLHTDPTRVDDPQWQLFDVESDPAETTDVAHLFPEKVRELAEAWDRAAWHNTVFPILNDRKAVQRRPDERRLAEPVKILAGTPTLERYRSSVLTSTATSPLTSPHTRSPGTTKACSWPTATRTADTCSTSKTVEFCSPSTATAGLRTPPHPSARVWWVCRCGRRPPNPSGGTSPSPSPTRPGSRGTWPPSTTSSSWSAWRPGPGSRWASTPADRWCGSFESAAGLSASPADCDRSPTPPVRSVCLNRSSRRSRNWHRRSPTEVAAAAVRILLFSRSPSMQRERPTHRVIHVAEARPSSRSSAP